LKAETAEFTCSVVIALLQTARSFVISNTGAAVTVAVIAWRGDSQPSLTFISKKLLYEVVLVSEVEKEALPTIWNPPPADING
jgi:hypothetical protein